MGIDWHVMLLPGLACVILAMMHAYLGLHIVERGVIFVDLALAQIAACGTAIATALGYELHSTSTYMFAVGSTLLGALILALSRRLVKEVAQEAFVGILYVVAASMMVIVLSTSPRAGEELHDLLVGHLLFVRAHDVLFVALLYGAIGLLHFFSQDKLSRITKDSEQAEREGIRVWWWDVFFYATFGVVVVSSVQLAGVLLVFALLVIPTTTTLIFAPTRPSRLFVSWIVSLGGCFLGLVASYQLDIPTGAAIVCGLAIPFVGVLAVNRT